MSTKRERLFQCVFRAGDLLRTAYVGAWTPEAAEAEFREALLLDGVLERGVILVRDSRGYVAVETLYEPDLLTAGV